MVAEEKSIDRKRDWLWVRFSFEEVKYLIFSCPRSGNEANRESVSMGIECLKIRFPLPTLPHARYRMKLKKMKNKKKRSFNHIIRKVI